MGIGITEFVTEKRKRLPHPKDLIQGLDMHLISSNFLKLFWLHSKCSGWNIQSRQKKRNPGDPGNSVFLRTQEMNLFSFPSHLVHRLNIGILEFSNTWSINNGEHAAIENGRWKWMVEWKEESYMPTDMFVWLTMISHMKTN